MSHRLFGMMYLSTFVCLIVSPLLNRVPVAMTDSTTSLGSS